MTFCQVGCSEEDPRADANPIGTMDGTSPTVSSSDDTSGSSSASVQPGPVSVTPVPSVTGSGDTQPMATSTSDDTQGTTGQPDSTLGPSPDSSQPADSQGDASAADTTSSTDSSGAEQPSETAETDTSDAGATVSDGSTSETDDTTACVVDHGGEEPSLHEYFADYFAMGAAIDTRYAEYTPILTKHFNSVTAEDQMKFDALQPTEGNFTYGTADQMVNFAIDNGMQVRGHALVWHRQTPSWVFNGTRDQVLARMQNHIREVMQHFKDRVKVWDVVNEAIMDDGSYRTNDEVEDQRSGWYGALGESYIAEAFKAARAADPEAKLFYNDYYNYHPARREAIFNMLKDLLDAGVPVDGVGLQAHLNLRPGTDPTEQSYHQTVENMEIAIEMYASLGLDVQITEMDLSLYLRGVTYTRDTFYKPDTVTTEVLNEQAERYRQFFEMFRKHADVISSVTFWGIADDNTWLSEFTSGRQDFPLLFDSAREPKPAFWSIVDFCP